MTTEILAVLVIAMAIMMGLYWRMARSSRASPWANVAISIILGWSATGVLAAGNKDIANDLAILTYCAIGITILLAMFGPHHQAKKSFVGLGIQSAKAPVKDTRVGPDEE
jgi:4-hydroxybenzoate polyprenyltransferase